MTKGHLKPFTFKQQLYLCCLERNIMNQMKNIAVYCGSNSGFDPCYAADARAIGRLIAQNGSRLIYGGGRIGLMGAVADATLAAGGEVVGVIPAFLREKEMAHTGLTELIETPDMTSRRVKMMELADGFIVLAGGLGTYEELFEVLSAAQLQLHAKPIGLLDSSGFFAPVMAMLRHTAEQGFMPLAHLDLLCIDSEPQALWQKMRDYRYRHAHKWQTP